MFFSLSKKAAFRAHIRDWYATHKRDLPRRKTTDPYCVFVSEMMLQQTQVARVIEKYHAWMTKWPTIFSFAQASRASVLQERVGLGFNRRAIFLHDACKIIATHAQGMPGRVKKIMSDSAYLLSLPGIGEYTANAICAFAYNQDVVVIDINIKRVLLHSFSLPTDTPHCVLQDLVAAVLPAGQARDWYNALMDYGALVLHSKKTGIRSPLQKPFKGSDREVRGRILKQLAHQNVVVYDDIQKTFPTKAWRDIIRTLVRDGLVRETNQGVSFPDTSIDIFMKKTGG